MFYQENFTGITLSFRGKNVRILHYLYLFVQGASCPNPTTVYVDMRALRNDRVTLVEKGSPHSLSVMESGKVSA